MKLKGKFTIISLEPGTCTELAVKKFAVQCFSKKPKIQYVKTFEEAVDSCKKIKNSILLLCHLHHLCSDLECNIQWRSLPDLAFFLKNPPIYLAENQNIKGKTCASIKTLQRLANIKNFKFIEAENTQQAAKMAANGQCRYSITNQTGLKKYHLSIVKELKKMTACWIPFSFNAHAPLSLSSKTPKSKRRTLRPE